MKLYDTARRAKVDFEPLVPGEVRMYVCGPTVYDDIHIGNARTFLSFDVIRRWLAHRGYKVTFAQNLTDVDDKIDQARQRARGAGRAGGLLVRRRFYRRHAPLRHRRPRHPSPRHPGDRCDDRHDRGAHRQGPCLRGRRRRVLLGAFRPGLRVGLGPQRRRPHGGRPHRGRRGQARPPRLRALEGGQARRAHLGLPVGPRTPGLALRVRRHGPHLPRHAHRHPRRWQRPTVPPPRERGRPGPLLLGRFLCEPLDAHRHAPGRRREDVQVPGQLLYPERGARPLPGRRPAAPYAPDPLPQPARLLLRAPRRGHGLARARGDLRREPALGRVPQPGGTRPHPRRGAGALRRPGGRGVRRLHGRRLQHRRRPGRLLQPGERGERLLGAGLGGR